MNKTEETQGPESCLTLLSRLQHIDPAPSSHLIFAGVGNRDAYNITSPFAMDGQQIIAGRVENRDVEHSEIIFFAETDAIWQPVPTAPTFPGLQDPCVTFIGGELVLGGVRFPVVVADGSVGWRMEFYSGTTLQDLKLRFLGPDKMKDIRLVELADERLGVLTRPQGAKGGRGKIGFFVAPNLDEITPRAIEEAPLFPSQCVEEEWVGSNQAHLLRNGCVGVLGHIAYFDQQQHRHYYPMIFMMDPRTGKATTPEIIAQRSDFQKGPAKRPDLTDVIFGGGLLRHANGTATLYAGLSDAEAGKLLLPDPFLKFEKTDYTPFFKPFTDGAR